MFAFHLLLLECAVAFEVVQASDRLLETHLREYVVEAPSVSMSQSMQQLDLLPDQRHGVIHLEKIMAGADQSLAVLGDRLAGMLMQLVVAVE